MHPEKWRRAVERAERYAARGGVGAEIPAGLLRKARGQPPPVQPRPKRRHRLSAYSRLKQRLRRRARPDAAGCPAQLEMIRHLLRARPSRCTVVRWRRRAYIGMLVATGQAKLAERLTGRDVMKLKLPAFVWAWVARWLWWRRKVIGEAQSAVLPWLECRVGRGLQYGPGGPHLRASVAMEMMSRGWPAWRAGRVARAGVPSRPWTRQETRGDCGPRCWPWTDRPVTFLEWARPRCSRRDMGWIRDLAGLAGVPGMRKL